MRKLCVLLLFLAGVIGQAHTTGLTQSMSSEIVVAAAANLTEVFTAMAQEFERATGIKVTLSFGSTGTLARQIENGAPFDLFAAADVATVDQLIAEGLLLPESRQIYARGRLILWWLVDSRFSVESFEDLLQPEIQRIALANPEIAPYGQAAKEALMALGLWETLQPKLVFADNVLAAKQVVATGNAEAAFIPISLVQPGKDRFLSVRGQLHAPLDQALGIVKASKNQEAAQRFASFLASEVGHAMLEDFWYSIPCAKGE